MQDPAKLSLDYADVLVVAHLPSEKSSLQARMQETTGWLLCLMFAENAENGQRQIIFIILYYFILHSNYVCYDTSNKLWPVVGSLL